MVAFVAGSGLGLSNTSLALLGQRGAVGDPQTGRAGEQAYVNVATGNLLLQRRDELVAATGADVEVVRTYNHLGTKDDDNRDNWRIGLNKRIDSVTGTINAAGSTVRRVSGDGLALVYGYDATRAAYVNKDGAGAFDLLVFDRTAQRWTWTDGDTQASERYDWNGSSGKIVASSDASGNSLSYGYSKSWITSVTDASGETTYLDYSGDELTAVRVVRSDGTVAKRVSYGYGGDGLKTVTVDLTPENAADASTHVTAYTYNNNRVSGITQTGGASLAFQYSSNRLTQITQVVGGLSLTTSLSYDTINRRTTVVDPLGNATVFSYDAANRLTDILGPVLADGSRQSTSFSYDADGNVATQTDARRNTVSYAYDGNGNQILRRDAMGNTVTRSYGARNELLAETVYTVPDPDGGGSAAASGAQTARYAYDASNRLRFAVSAEGRVTEYRYDAKGQREVELAYAGTPYKGTQFDEAALAAWAAAADGTRVERTETAYDFRGQVSRVTRYDATDATGAGQASGRSDTLYAYDFAGRLLQTTSLNAAAGLTTKGSTVFTYDGLDRLATSTDPAGHQSVTLYDDANNKTMTRIANGLATTYAYSAAGQLLSVTPADGSTALGTTRYSYDAGGLRRMAESAIGVRQYWLYDAAGRQVAQIDGDGSLTESVYDGGSEVVSRISYARTLSAAQLASLVDGAGNPAQVALASVRPGPTAADRRTWTFYDAAGRVAKEVDELGYVTETRYDGASRRTAAVRYANRYTGVLAVTTAPDQIATAPDAANDRVTRFFHDADGRLAGTLDPEGALATNEYDAAGRLLHTMRYAGATAPSLRASGTLAQLVPARDDAQDAHEWTFYDASGRAVASIDAEGYVTETGYDRNGNRVREVRYGARAVVAPAQITATMLLAQVRPAANADPAAPDRVTSWTYTALGQVATRTDHQGTVTVYAYDDVGNLVRTERAWNTSDARTAQQRFDKLGRLVAELGGQGSAALAALPAGAGQADIDAVWTRYGTTFTYDLAGQRTSMTNANGARTLYYYDAAGRLVATINALGEVTELGYNAFGEQTREVRYGTRLKSTMVEPMAGGLMSSAVSGAIGDLANLALDSTTTQAYEQRGLLSTRTDPLGFTATSTYDAFGELDAATNPIDATTSVTTRFRYDRRGLLTTTTRDAGGLGVTTATKYDVLGRRLSATEGPDASRAWTYDRLGRIASATDATLATSFISYDAFGQVLSQTDALGKRTTYHYDAAERSVTVTSPEKVVVKTRFTRTGQTLSVSDATGTTSYRYDLEGRLESAVDATGRAVQNRYDAVGNLLRTTDQDGNSVSFGYDAANRRITRIVDPGTMEHPGLYLLTAYEYDAKGQQVRITEPNLVTQLTFDLNGQLTKRQVDPDGLNLETSYGYDAVGRVLTVTAAGTISKSTYDKLGRRTMEQVDVLGLNLTRSWTYDSHGNATSLTDADERVTRYVYDAENRLTHTVNAAGEVARNVYDRAGRVIRTVRHANTVSLVGLPLTITAAQAQPLADAERDATVHTVRDADGRVAGTATSLGGGKFAIATYRYDTAGREIERLAYATPVAMPDPAAIPSVPASPADQRLRTVYDALGRVSYTIDGFGAVTATKYDGTGRVVDQVAYASAVDPGTQATEQAITQALAAKADASRDRRLRQGYDTAGRLAWSVDGQGAVTAREYDAQGNLMKVTQRATALAPDADPASAPWSPNDRVTWMTYDGAGRVVYTVDALGAVVQNFHDRQGNIVRRSAWAAPLADAVVRTTADIAKALSGADAARTERFAYDGGGRQVFAIDALGGVVENVFDGAGNNVGTIRYHQRLASAALATTLAVADIRKLVKPDDARNRIVQRALDAAGREQYTVDPLGYVTASLHDGLGRVIRTIRYAARLAAGTAITTAALDAWARSAALSGEDRASSLAYDAGGRLVLATDALKNSERFAYDALGRKTSFTNRKGATWSYTYDAAGRLKTETAPAVLRYAATANAAGDLVGTPAASSVAIVTALEYDALGNLLARTEASGLAEQRTTRYGYDTLGRQVSTEAPPVGVYDAAEDPAANGAAALAARAETQQVLTTRTAYDALGNAVSGIDAAGGASYKVYDQAGRLAYHIDALGYVVQYRRNAFGEVTAVKRFAAALPAIPADLSLKNVERLASGLAGASDRVLTTEYDAAGRAVEVSEPEVAVYDADTGAAVQAGRSTRKEYNAFGEVTRTFDGRSTTDHFFDQRGQEVATVDAMGYVTTFAYNATGELASRTEFATSASVQLDWGSAPVQPTPPVVAASADDRTITYGYDLLGRKVAETRLQVEVAGHLALVSQASGTVTLAPSQPVPPSYTPEGGGRIDGLAFASGADGGAILSWPAPPADTHAVVQWRVRNTQAWNSATELVATDGGRQALTLAPTMPAGAYEVQVLHKKGETVVDAQLGVVSFFEPTSAAPAFSGSGITLAWRPGGWSLQWAAPAGDTQSTFSFKRPGSNAWETATTLAEGATQYVMVPAGWPVGSYAVKLEVKRFTTTRTDLKTTYDYDAVGNLARTTDALQGSTFNYYDALGRLTATVTPAVVTSAQGDTALPLVQYFRDAHGSAVGSVSRAHGAAAANTGGYTLVDAAGHADDRWEGSAFDALGRARQVTDAQGASRFFSYDALGNVAKRWQAVSDVAGVATIYEVSRYDKLGRLVRTVTPAPAGIDGITSGTSVVDMAYNAFGEMTGRWVDGATADAQYWHYDNAGRMWRSNAGDGVDRVTLYDAQGHATVRLENSGVAGDVADVLTLSEAAAAASADGRRTVMHYDKLGRLVRTDLPAETRATGGVTVTHVATGITRERSAAPSYPADGSGFATSDVLAWEPANKVVASWSSLAALGSGDVKVQLSYTTAAYDIAQDGIHPAAHSAGVERSLTRMFTAEEAAAGVTLEWTDPPGSEGGISFATGLIVWKKDVFGQWAEVVRQSGAPGDVGNSVTIDAPADPLTGMEVKVSKAGSGQWQTIAARNFGEQLRFDAATLADGSWDYTIAQRLPGSANWVVTASGAFTLTRPVLPGIGVKIMPSATSTGTYQWTRPEGDVVQSMRYRRAASSDVWRLLTVVDLPGGLSGVDASGLPFGEYDFELMYNRPGEVQPFAHATGKFQGSAQVGFPPIANVQLRSAADGSATMDWPTPTDGSMPVARYRLQGATTAWTAMSVTTNASTGRQSVRLGTEAAAGTYDVEVLQQLAGQTVRRAAAIFVMQPGIVNPATTVDKTPPYTAAYTEPARGTPPVPGAAFAGLANGDWSISWTKPPAGTAAKIEIYDAGAWVDQSKRITTVMLPGGALQERVLVQGFELPPASYDLRLTWSDATGLKNISLGTVTLYDDRDLPATLVDTTPPYTPEVNQPAKNYPVIAATFAAAADGSWTLEWAKPPAGQVTTVNYRPKGTSTWTSWNSRIQTTTTTEKIALGATALAQGSYEVDVFFTGNGVRTQQAMRTVTVNPPSYAPASIRETTPFPFVDGLGWAAETGGSKLWWWAPAAGSTAKLRLRQSGTTNWLDYSSKISGGTSVQLKGLADGVWATELTVVDATGAVTHLATGNLTVSGEVHTSMVNTTPTYKAPVVRETVSYALIPITFATAADGSWSLQWNTPPTGSTAQLRYRPDGTSTWQSLTARIVNTTPTTQKASFVAADLVPGTYELDLYFVSATGVRTDQYHGDLTVSSVPPKAATAVDTTPPYEPAVYKPAVNYPIIKAAFLPNADGSWRLQWTTPAAGTTASLRHQPPGAGAWVDDSAAIVTIGATQYIDVADNWPAGISKVDLAFMTGGSRVAQFLADVTTAEDAVPATMVATPTGYVPEVYHPAVNYPPITGTFTANADGGWSINFPPPPAGSLAKTMYRAKGSTTWLSADPFTTSLKDGSRLVTMRASQLTPGVYEVDISYETNGKRSAQALGEVTMRAPTPVAPQVTAGANPYVPVTYSIFQDKLPSPTISAVQSFTATSAITGIAGTAFVLTNDGGSILQWDQPPSGVTSTFRYRVWGTSLAWSQLAPQTANGVQSVVVPPDMPAGIYEADLTLTDTAGNVVGRVGGRLTVPVPGSSSTVPTISQFEGAVAPGAALRAVVRRTLDRWGNVLQQNDPRNQQWVTQYRYNAVNQVVEQTQPDAYGSLAGGRAAVTRLYYDQLGRQIGVLDANGHAEEQFWDAAGDLTAQVHADGGAATYSYSVFRDRIQASDEIGRVTSYGYDKLSRPTSTTFAPVNVSHIADDRHTRVDEGAKVLGETIAYDEAGRKKAQTNTGQERTSYRYDLRGNVIATTQGAITTRMAYDAEGRKVAERDGNGATATWRYSHLGKLLAHTDLGGASYTYVYDSVARTQLRRQYNNRGVVEGVNLKQDLQYTYDAAGNVVSINDASTNTLTEYGYDLAGNRVRERTRQGTIVNGSAQLAVYQDNHVAYDALGRLQWVGDGRAAVTIDYDKVGNRTHIATHVIDGSDAAHDAERYFQYDAMNRQTVADAVDSTGTLGTSGHAIAYDKAGNKLSDSWMGRRVTLLPGTQYTVINYHGETQSYETTVTMPPTWRAQLGLTTEHYTVDTMGRVQSIDRDGKRVDDRFYDAAGRIAFSGPKDPLDPGYVAALNGTSSAGASLPGNGAEVKTYLYDAWGRMINQRVHDSRGDREYDLASLQWDNAGNVKSYRVENTRAGMNTDYTYTYQLGERYQEHRLQAVRVGSGLESETITSYDGNGFLQQVVDTGLAANNRHFVNDAAGRALHVQQGEHVQRQLIVGGEVLGRYGEVVDDAQPAGADGSRAFQNLADFGFAFQPTGGRTPVASGGTRMVSAGDTLQSIAHAAYGDSRLWYRIADANGLAGNNGLRAGQVLKIPTMESSGNAAGTFRPYDAGRVVGDTTPYLPMPNPQAGDGGCGGMGQVITVAIAVVVAALTEQWYLLDVAVPEGVAFTGAALEGSTLTLTSSAVYSGVDTFVANAVGAGAGSIASQAAAVAAGMQDDFNWKSVGLSAISGGVGSTVAANIGEGAAAVGDAIRRAALTNVLTQGIGVVTGLQRSFDWRSVAASAAGAGVASGVSGALGADPEPADGVGPVRPAAFSDLGWTGQVLRGGIAASAGGLTTAVMRGGRVSVQQVAADAFGNALGQRLVDQANQPSTQAMAAVPAANTPFPDANDTFYGAPKQAAGQSEFVCAVKSLSEDGVDDYEGTDVAALSGRNGLGLRINPMLTAGGGTRLKAGGGLGLSAPSSGLGLNLNSDSGFNSIFDLGIRFVRGAFYGAVNMVWQPVAQTLDLGQAGIGLLSGGRYEPRWLSGVSRNYAADPSARTWWRGLIASNFISGTGLAAHDLTISATQGDWRGVAEDLGNFAGTYGLVKGGQRYFAPEPGAQLGVYRVRPAVQVTDPLVDPGNLLAPLAVDQSPSFINPRPVFVADRPLHRLFDNIKAFADGRWWVDKPLPSSEGSWRSGYAVTADYNLGNLEASYTSSGQWGWGGKAAPQAVKGYSDSFTLSGSKYQYGWIQTGGKYQLFFPAGPGSGISTRLAPWNR